MNGEHLRVTNPLTLRLLKRLLVFSALLIVLLAGARAWWEYQTALAAVQEEFAVIESTNAKSVASSLWDYDREHMDLHVEGIRHFRYISYASVFDASGVVAQSGVRRIKGVLDREFPLSVVYNGKRQELGVLHVQADLESLRVAAWQTARRVLAYNIALVLLVTGLMFWLTRSMISRHLAAFAAHLSTYSLGGENKPLVLDKKKSWRRTGRADARPEQHAGRTQRILRPGACGPGRGAQPGALPPGEPEPGAARRGGGPAAHSQPGQRGPLGAPRGAGGPSAAGGVCRDHRPRPCQRGDPAL